MSKGIKTPSIKSTNDKSAFTADDKYINNIK